MERSEGSLEDFKAQLPLVEIVGKTVKLTRRGREWIGLCPFHKEKSPSFAVVPDKGFYHCFGCGVHGNAIDFVMAIDRLEFPEALQRLEELTGIRAPRRQADATAKVDPGLYDANLAAAGWFVAQLRVDLGREAREYLTGRGLDRAALEAFSIGWAPADRHALGKGLQGLGFKQELLIDAGLLKVPEHGGEPFAQFRERVMFPIRDARGRVVGFGGRALGDIKPKYLNTAETELFQKGRLLYNLDRAQSGARSKKLLVVAEGYMDAIALDRAGLPAVAPLGTAVTEDQLQAIWKLVDLPVICLDGDSAGLRAAWRVAERAAPLLTAERSLRFALLPEGEDPDSIARREGGAALAQRIEQAEALSRFLWRLLRRGQFTDLQQAEQRAGLRASMRRYVSLVTDRSVRESLSEQFETLLADELQALSVQRRWRRDQPGGPRATNRPRVDARSGYEGSGPAALASSLPRARAAAGIGILAPLLEDPGLLEHVEVELEAFALSDPELDSLRLEILHAWAQKPGLDGAAMISHLTRYGFTAIVARVQSGFDRPTDGEREHEDSSPLERWREVVGRLRRESVRRQELAQQGGEPDMATLFGNLNRLLNAGDEETTERPALDPGVGS